MLRRRPSSASTSAAASAAAAASAPTVTPTSAPANGLVAAYSFDEGSGVSVGDASGKGNGGSIGSATWTSQARFGSALYFNGSNARVTVPDSNSLDLTTGMTLEAWVHPLSSHSWRDVVYKGWNDIYYLEASSDSGPPAVGGISFGEVKGTATLPANAWSHIAGTYDGSTLRMYVNGTQVASRARTGNISTSTTALTIGGDALYGQHFHGRIDEVRVYGQALTAARSRPT